MNLIEQKKRMGKRITKEDKFKFEKFGRSTSGAFFKTKIGLSNVYKMGPKDYLADGTFIGMGGNVRNKTIEGYNILKENKFPVTEFRGVVNIRGEPRLVFEKARDLTKQEIKQRLPKILDIIDKAMEKRICIDSHLDNFGINKEGKLMVRDTNYLSMGRSFEMIDELTRDPKIRGRTDLMKIVENKRNELRTKYMKK